MKRMYVPGSTLDRVASFHTHRWVPWNLRPVFSLFKLITHEPVEILASDDSTNTSGLCWRSNSSTYPKQKSRFSREILQMVDKGVYLAVGGGIIYHIHQSKQGKHTRFQTFKWQAASWKSETGMLQESQYQRISERCRELLRPGE